MPIIKRILVPYDFSHGASAALRYAVSLAEAVNASIELLHVWEPGPYVDPTLMLAAGGRANDLSAQYTKDANERLAKAIADKAASIAERVAPMVIAGYPSTTIVRHADDGNFDLVVMGTRGLTGLKHLLLGSVAERVVQRCNKPVLTLHAAASAE